MRGLTDAVPREDELLEAVAKMVDLGLASRIVPLRVNALMFRTGNVVEPRLRRLTWLKIGRLAAGEDWRRVFNVPDRWEK